MSKKITFQLFVIMFICLMITVSIIFLFQAFFFSKFYEHKKEEMIRNHIDNFISDYNSSDWDYEQYIDEVQKLEYDNSITVEMTNNKDIPISTLLYNKLKMYNVELIDDNGTVFNFYVNKIRLNEHKLTVGKRLYFTGEIYDSTVYIYYIAEDRHAEKMDVLEDTINPQIISTTASISKIEKTNMTAVEISEIIGGSYKLDVTPTEIYRVNFNESEEYFEFDSGIKPLNIKRSFQTINGDTIHLYAYTTLQSISEANSMLLEYFAYIFLVIIIVIVIVSIVYSRQVARPLLNLKNTAIKMANLDFSEKAHIKSKNEMGDIADSLNVLADNLQNSLSNLYKKNEQLKCEISKVKKQELIRREFVANVSHELKTPLGVIKGYAEAIGDRIHVDKQDEYTDIIIKEVAKTNKLVLDMLSLSRIEAPNSNLKLVIFDIHELIQDAADMLSINAEEKGCRIVVKGKGYNVLADKKMMGMALLNLLSNGVKNSYCNKDIQIKVEKKGDYVKISVYNIGENIPENIQENIWERFYKVDKSHSRDDEGTGLGLAIVKAILEKHGSEYGIENTMDGVIVYFTLELA